MNSSPRIACFFSCGYTELSAMKSFLQKINNSVEYIQLCPARERKNKKDNKERRGSIKSSENGLTCEGLIDYLCGFIARPRFADEQYDAILIEDDRDDRFLDSLGDGTSKINPDKWKEYKDKLRERIAKIRPGIPVLFLCAAPEIEAWFLADWERSFGSVYADRLDSRQNQYFSTVFRKHVFDEILQDSYRDKIENYGYCESVYKKLSEEIQNALKKRDFLPMSKKQEFPAISYSKRQEGALMLEKINPEKVKVSCRFLFSEGYRALKEFSVPSSTKLP